MRKKWKKFGFKKRGRKSSYGRKSKRMRQPRPGRIGFRM